MKNRSKLPAAFLSLLIIFLLVLPSQAMPGFARKYRMSCTTCHAPFPRLKDYGDEYAGNGFRLPEGEPKRSIVDTGDPLLELQRDVSLGFRIDLHGTYEDDGDPSDADLKTPYNLKIISGGPIAENLAYYVYFFFSEHGEIAGIEDAFIFISDLFKSGINLTLGQFAVSDPLLKGELRLTYEGYEIFKRKPRYSYANLKYDRGIVVDYGTEFGLDLVLQVVNGNGIGEAEGGSKNFDFDDPKNVMFRAAQSVGPASVGGFVYYGDEEHEDDQGKVFENTVRYIGGDATLTVGPAQLTALYFERTDDNGYFMPTSTEISSTGLVIEATVVPDEKGRWAYAALYNRFDSDYEALSPDDTELDYETVTLNVSYLLRRNARCLAEYTRIVEDKYRGTDFADKNRFVLGMVVGF